MSITQSGSPSADRCSDLSGRLALSGTAPTAPRWWLIEHRGPWGAHAVRDSDQSWIAALAGVPPEEARVLLIRPHGLHKAVGSPNQPRRILTFAPGDPLVRAGSFDVHEDPGIEDVAAPPSGARWHPTADHPRALVCTNGRRDRCCAERGRAVWQHLPARVADRVWECTHLGGHRFAPVALTVPSGVVLGRITPQALTDLVHRDELDLSQVRGRCDLRPPEQVAERAARELWSLHSAGLRLDVASRPVAGLGDAFEVTVHHPDGRSRHFIVERRDGESIPASCGGEPVKTVAWRLRADAPSGASSSAPSGA